MNKAKTILLTVWLTIGTLGTIVAVIEAYLGIGVYTAMKDDERARRRRLGRQRYAEVK